MLAALIPAGVVCGNKVPTVCFPDDPTEDRLFLWLAIVNSIPFDWLLRRVLTTTINDFVLLSIALPPDREIEPGRAAADPYGPATACAGPDRCFGHQLANSRLAGTH